MGTRHLAAMLCLPLVAGTALAASYGELAQMQGRQPWERQFAPGMPNCCPGPNGGQPLYPGYAGGPMMAPGYGLAGGYNDAPQVGRMPTAMPYLPVGTQGLPTNRQTRWTYGQVNASSDPFNAWGLSTPNMFVPWSTPMSGWTNAQTWDWWRTRAGDPGPPLPLW